MDPFVAQCRLIVDELTSPKEQSARLASFAATEIAKTKAANERAIGGAQPAPAVTVDGRKGAPLTSVKPTGRVVAEFDLMGEVIEAIGDMLLKEAPVLSGAFRDSIRVFADGVEHFPGAALPTAERYVFLSPLPYARKIEGANGRSPLSDQAPSGVFQVVASVAAKQFGNVARIGFGFESVVKAPTKSTRAERVSEQESRVPAIFVEPR